MQPAIRNNPCDPPRTADFVSPDSIVRRIWGNGDMVLLVFAGSAAEFALNRAVDWLFFTGKVPEDPIGRLFSTAGYTRQIVFADHATAARTLARIRAIHEGVENKRGERIPDWAHRDVLYMLIDYSERAHAALDRPLTTDEQKELHEVFFRVGTGLGIPDLPATYANWKIDREVHLHRDLVRSRGTDALYAQYRKQLGAWRYRLLLAIQSLLATEHVRNLLGLSRATWLEPLLRSYPFLVRAGLRSVIRTLLMPSKYLAAVRALDHEPAPHSVRSPDRRKIGARSSPFIEAFERMAGVARRVTGAGALAIGLGISLAPRAEAQQGRDLLGAGSAFLGVGASGVSTGKLDDRLAAIGYPTFGSSAVGVNAGAHLILPGGLTVGAEWHGLIVGDAVHRGRDVGIGGGYGTLGLGYMVNISPRIRAYPRLGLGGGGMGLWIESDSVVGFDEVLDDPQPTEDLREPVLNTASAVIDVGAGAEILPGGFARGLMLGLRVGYLKAFDTDWEYRDQTVSGGPSANIGGPYVRALIGIAWKR